MTGKKGIANMMDFVNKEAQEVIAINEVHKEIVKDDGLTPLYIMVPKHLKRKFDLYCVNNDTTKRAVITNFLSKLLDTP